MLQATKVSAIHATTDELPSPIDALIALISERAAADSPHLQLLPTISSSERRAFRLGAGIALATEAWRLSRRQREVLVLAAQGFTNKQMAFELGCCPKTIEVHVTGLLKKSGVASRNELVAKLIHTCT